MKDCRLFVRIMPLPRTGHYWTMLARKRFFDALFRIHNNELLTFARLRAGAENAEDLVQEAYARMLQHPEPETIENPRAFLYKTAFNLNIDQHRQQRVRDRVHSQFNEADSELEWLIGHEKAPEEQLALQQELKQLNTILMELPQLTRYAFVLHRLEGLSHKETAERLGISVRSSERRTTQAAHYVLSRFQDPEQ